ncbi:MAG: phosphorylcholine transferase LicD [Roseburia inulinivorans]
MVQVEMSIDEIHEATLEILKVIDSIAKKLKIKYFMAYGSLIGVVRHKGFIPWDDDLDLMMLREDYEKFLVYFAEHEQELMPYKIFTNRNNKDYPNMIARVCNVNYPIQVENEIPCGMGIFVDIYPIDPMGKSEKKWKRIMRYRQQLIAACYYASRVRFEKPKKKYRSIDRYLLYLYAKNKGIEYFKNKLEKYKDKFDWENSDYAGCIVWEPELFDKNYFNDTVRLPFCDMQVLVPREYDSMLRKSYGDYMKLPPEKDRKPQHKYKAYRTKA